MSHPTATAQAAAAKMDASTFAAWRRCVEAVKFDLVSVGRSLIADPDWVNKVRDGRYEKIQTFRKTDIDSVEWESDWAP